MITQRIRIVSGTDKLFIVNGAGLFSGMQLYTLTTLPTWVSTVSFPPWISAVYVDATSVAPSTTTVYFTKGGSPSIADACLIIEVVDSLITIGKNCKSNLNKNLVWITREGGRASYIFDQRKNYSVVVGDSKVFENANNEVKYISRGKVYDSVTVYKSGVSENEIDYITSLRNSIQAWEYNDSTNVFTPIIIEEDDFDTYNTKTSFNELSLTYRYAKQKQIQNG